MLSRLAIWLLLHRLLRRTLLCLWVLHRWRAHRKVWWCRPWTVAVRLLDLLLRLIAWMRAATLDSMLVSVLMLLLMVLHWWRIAISRRRRSCVA